ncbi:hypothetical protein D3C73_1536830 [compost metagenome]
MEGILQGSSADMQLIAQVEHGQRLRHIFQHIFARTRQQPTVTLMADTLGGDDRLGFIQHGTHRQQQIIP